MGQPPELDMAQAQLKKLELEIEKLNYDVQNLGSISNRVERVIKFIPLITTLIAIGGFWFTVHQYNAQQAAASDKVREEREKSLKAPLWEKRLNYYFQATEVAATIATSKDQTSREKAEAKFKELYYGPLVIIEDPAVESAMIKFNYCLTGQEPCDEAELAKRSLGLSHSARKSIEEAFEVELGKLKGQ